MTQIFTNSFDCLPIKNKIKLIRNKLTEFEHLYSDIQYLLLEFPNNNDLLLHHKLSDIMDFLNDGSYHNRDRIINWLKSNHTDNTNNTNDRNIGNNTNNTNDQNNQNVKLVITRSDIIYHY